jgi:glycerol kinase
MKEKLRLLHVIIVSLLLSTLCWMFVDRVLVEISFIKYLAIEGLVLISGKVYKWLVDTVIFKKQSEL